MALTRGFLAGRFVASGLEKFPKIQNRKSFLSKPIIYFCTESNIDVHIRTAVAGLLSFN